jgi:hypothetical protein
MSFGGVDEKKLVAEAKEQLLPAIDPMLRDLATDFVASLRQLLDDSEITITVKKKELAP